VSKKHTYKADPAFLALGEGYGDTVEAANFPHTILRYRNDRAAKSVGLDHLSDEAWIRHFGRFEALPDNLAAPIAQRYHGHQFRHYNPDIGDGRGFLFAQLRDDQGRLLDLGTKGSGTTPYSRAGDGRLTLKGGVREILATELLEALGADNSKTLSIIETGEQLQRGDEPSPTRSAVMVRLNHSHIRIGTFQRLAFFSETELLNKLVTYCLKNYFGTDSNADASENVLTFLRLVSARVAVQAADLMAAGFVHGVLNTDNINITGEIFDFGPWRFLPSMELSFTAAYFDERGLYSFGRQPEALHWNIYQLAGSFADICEEDALKEALSEFPALYHSALRSKLLARVGVKPQGDQIDDTMLKLVNGFLASDAQGSRIGYERFFFDWFGGGVSKDRAMTGPEAVRYKHAEAADMVAIVSQYAPVNDKALDAPYFQNGAPCTLLIDEVEDLWSHIAESDNWGPFNDKIKTIRQMGDALKAD